MTHYIRRDISSMVNNGYHEKSTMYRNMVFIVSMMGGVRQKINKSVVPICYPQVWHWVRPIMV